MPTGVYVRKNAVDGRLRTGMAKDHSEGFAEWLREQRYTPHTISEKLRLLACWTHWAQGSGYSLETVRDACAASLALAGTGQHLRFPGNVIDAVATAKLFIAYLEDKGALPRLPEKALPPLYLEYAAWAREQRGIADSTLKHYGNTIIPFIAALGGDPAAYTAASIRAHVVGRAGRVSAARLKGMTVAIRALLRFLIATGRCPPGLDNAMPGAAGWRLTSIPRFLSESDIARVITACDGEKWLRNRAIILLLVRLGLRAGEVARLTFADIDWQAGTIRLFGKNRREELLPLTQEVGEALIAWLERGRPTFSAPELFLTGTAPLRPMSRVAIKCVVASTLRRAGVESRCKGAHVLRHSAATAMLRHGVSLRDVGSVLRHRSPSMTAHYAKADVALLSSIAQPWPGRSPC